MQDPIGFRKTSLVDYPAKVAAVLFFPGCNLRCPWCHNRELVDGRGVSARSEFVSLETAIEVIRKRRNVLGGVVLSGGEPLLRADMGILIGRIKQEGLAVKLDTNGTLPDALETLLKEPDTTPDYIAVDLKVAPDKYRSLGFGPGAVNLRKAIERTTAILASSSVNHEFRSLALPSGFFTDSDVSALAPLVDSVPWFFSVFRPGNCLEEAWNAFSQSDPHAAKSLAKQAIAQGKDGRVR